MVRPSGFDWYTWLVPMRCDPPGMFSTMMVGLPGSCFPRWRPTRRPQLSYPPPGASATTMVTVLPCHIDASDGSTVEGEVLAAAGDAAGEADGEPAGAAPGEAAGLSEAVVGFGAVVGVDGALGEQAVSNAAAMEPRTESATLRGRRHWIN